MRKHIYSVIFFATILVGCSSWKHTLVVQGGQNEAIHNAVVDFLHTDKLSKKDSVFSIRIIAINNHLLGMAIIGRRERISPTEKNRIGTNESYFPTRYLDIDGKLFYWYDSTHTVNKELIDALSKYKFLDSAYVKGLIKYPNTPGYHDSKKATDYYICLCDLRKYVKVHTTIAMGYYEPPALDCHCNIDAHSK
jgi:hypothetical protein